MVDFKKVYNNLKIFINIIKKFMSIYINIFMSIIINLLIKIFI